jgi:Thioredoxin like C-terminal domain
VDRRRLLATGFVTLVAGHLGILRSARAQSTRTLPIEGEMPPLDRATTWLNSPPLTTASLRGKVVLINFEKDLDNVRRAATDLTVRYPIAVDNDYALWQAFANQYWPALYFVDVKGRIRHHHFGEGAFERSEQAIQQLLLEAGVRVISRELVSPDARGAEAAADWASLKSPENYLGYARTQNFASLGGAVPDRRRAYVIPARLELNHWGLSGDWTVQKEAVVLNQAKGRIAYRFHARDVHLIMGPAARGLSLPFRVLIDGRPPGAAHGTDVDERGHGTLTQQRMYQLIRQPKPIGDRQFEIEFLESGVEAFAFTFG